MNTNNKMAGTAIISLRSLHTGRGRFAIFALTAALSVALADDLTAQPTSLPNIQTIVDAWEVHAARIRSGRFVWTKRQEMPRSLLMEVPGAKLTPKSFEGVHVSETTCIYTFNGEKMRLEIRGNAPSINSAAQLAPFAESFVFDGKKTKELQPAIGERKSPQGALLGEKNSVIMHPSLVHLMWNLRPKEMMNGVSKWEIGSAKDIPDNRLITLTAVPALKGQKHIFWLDPAKDYAIVRFISTDSNTEMQLLRVDLFLAREEAVGWIPKGWTIIERVSKRGNSVVSSAVDEFSVNSGTESEDFQLDYPAGTVVINDKGKEVQPTGSRRLVWLGAGIGFLILLLFLFIVTFWRRTQKERPSTSL